MVDAISTVICQVADMDRAVGFYRDVLGLAPGVVSPYWSDFLVGSVRIGLHPPFNDVASSPDRHSGWIIGLAVPDLKALHRTLQASGFPTQHGFHAIPGGVVLDFNDPDGNPLQAMQEGVSIAEFN